MAKIKANTLILASGRQIKLRGGTISIASSLELGDGYTSGVFNFNSDSKYTPEINKISNPYNLTAEEIHEVADLMISLWVELKNNIRIKGVCDPAIFTNVVSI
ncbi:hypothetical protein PV783_14025 [Chitinophaga sp. CC14]|uniref:hypothetical protein n=1 Tax=Chitinophaga sp. CC14 TaxID=3029199 RepID=UPI003B7C78E3